VYRVEINARDVARGEYVEIVPPSRIVFTWGWESADSKVPPGSSTVEVSLIPDGNGTIVRLRHFGLPMDEREIHAGGWEHYLERLELAAQGRAPSPDPWANLA
jgi:uncharacterized protein YndB with AHSA1/START domain